MKIEDELKTDVFENNYHRVTLNILVTANWINGQFKARTDKERVTLPQYNILRILRGQYPNPSTINMIKERLLDKMSDVSRLIDRLVQKELVSRSTSDVDRRSVDILITEKGLRKLEKLDEPMKVRNILNQNLTEDECILLNDLLDKIRDTGDVGKSN